jgi:hypothetical protein
VGDEGLCVCLNRSDEKKSVEVDFRVLLAAMTTIGKYRRRFEELHDFATFGNIRRQAGKDVSLVEMPPIP